MSATIFSRFDDDPPPALPKELEALRALLDTRLAALEAALADPDQYNSIERRLNDLVRAATEEADAAVRQAYVEAQREARDSITAVRAEAKARHEAERATSASLRQDVEQAHAALQAERSAAVALRHDLEAARLTLKREQTAAMEGQRKLNDAQATAASLGRDLDTTRLALDEEQTTAATLQRELDAARGAADAERSMAERLRDTVARLESELAEAHDDAHTRVNVLTTAQTDLDLALKESQAHAKEATRERQALAARLDAATAEAAKAEADAHARYEQLRDASQAQIDTLEQAVSDADTRAEAATREREDLAARLDAATAEAARVEADARARYEQLRDASQAQIDALEQTVSDADTRAEAATRERDALAAGLDAATAEAAKAEADAHARYEQLHESTRQQIRELQLAVGDAEARAQAAIDELQHQRQDLKPDASTLVPSAESTAIATSPPPDSATKAPAAPAASPPEPLRQASRYVLSAEVEVQVDGSPAWLIDLSFSGAQVLSAASLKPNTVVRLAMPLSDRLVLCKGKIVWAHIDPTKRGGQLRYRAGVLFTFADEAGIKAFLSVHLPT